MKCYRLSKAEHVATALSGRGSMLAGQRWNSKGVAVAYAGPTPASCLVEAMMHVHDDGFPLGWRMLEIEIPDDSIATLQASRYPPAWDGFPYRADVQRIGDEWVASNRSLVLAVSSAVDKTSKNYLINPAHPGFARIPKPVDITDAMDLQRIAQRLRANKS